MSKHVKTDPVCTYFREPRTFIGRWKYDRARGKACMTCRPNVAARQHAAIHDEYLADTTRALEGK